MNKKMKIVVIGGSGLIGTRVVNNLRQQGHAVVAASPSSGVNTVTGEGLADALSGAQVVVDVANSPSFEDKAALEFFETSGHNSSRRKRRRESATMSRCRSSAPNACLRAATSARRWPRKT